MFPRRSQLIKSSDESGEDTSDDEPAVIIEKIEHIDQNGEKFERSYEIPGSRISPLEENIKSLCRVCSSKGFININSVLTDKLLIITPIRSDKKLWQKPISRIIAEISGEDVSEDDGLPQFICQHCLNYLQHAYSMRLKIISNLANLRTVKQLACEQSLLLEQSHMKNCRVNAREVKENHDDMIEESKFLETFKGADISISFMNGPTATARSSKVIEYKCLTCKKRMMTPESLASHQKNCEMTVIWNFDAHFRFLVGLVYVRKITLNEFVLRIIKLIFDTQKDLVKIVNKNGINLHSISSSMPCDAFDQRNYQSPDFGYSSGDTKNVDHPS